MPVPGALRALIARITAHRAAGAAAASFSTEAILTGATTSTSTSNTAGGIESSSVPQRKRRICEHCARVAFLGRRGPGHGSLITDLKTVAWCSIMMLVLLRLLRLQTEVIRK